MLMCNVRRTEMALLLLIESLLLLRLISIQRRSLREATELYTKSMTSSSTRLAHQCT
ncbi:hypothetical protein COMA2_150112 [Candidatus Nitrospira nitrificans]|uniref:Uncharacterized protein n=1 Tax=Candidatus Nitrospira nitrificans TaxID=1742973 RepID=A0A0S4LBI4_9BACT|nr:hypothetical protein COMA2_150112 [Candidatus Nitrospira nitrificans]